MGLWKAGEVAIEDLGPEFLEILAEEETGLQAYKFSRDYFVFTDKRLILVDRQGISGRKVEYHSIPYRAITHYSVESAGSLDRDADLKVWVSGDHKPIERDLSRDVDTKALLRMLAQYVA